MQWWYPGSRDAFLGPQAQQPINNSPWQAPGFQAPMPAWLKNYKVPDVNAALKAINPRAARQQALASALDAGDQPKQPQDPYANWDGGGA